MNVVHQHFLHPVEHANDRILFHCIEVAVVEGGVVECHHASFAIHHRHYLVVHEGSDLGFEQVALHALHAVQRTVFLTACALRHVRSLVIELTAEGCRRSDIECFCILFVCRQFLCLTAYDPVSGHDHVHELCIAVTITLGVCLQVIKRILVRMVGDQHHFVFVCHLRPLEQIHFVVQYGTRDTNEAVGILEAQTVKSVTKDILHLLCKARIRISYIVLHYVDNTQVLHFVRTAGLEERIQLAVGTLQVLGSIERIGNAFLEQLGVFLLLLFANLSVTGSCVDVCLVEQFDPTLQLASQRSTFVFESLVLEEHIFLCLARRVHIVCIGHETADSVETAIRCQHLRHILCLSFFL